MCDRQSENYKKGHDRKGLFYCDQQHRDKNSFSCKLWCYKTCSFCRRVAAKERLKSRSSYCNKYCERGFLCRSIEFCKSCHKCPNCCSGSTCRGQVTAVLGKMGSPGISPKMVTVLKEGYTLPFQFWPNLTRSPNIISCSVNPHRNLYLLETLHQLMN